eukprot:scaffold3020_cov118-Cylindrotheca_fusiformis.AAC.1
MDITCILAALLFFIANLLQIIYYGLESTREDKEETATTLDHEDIEAEWNWRIEHKPQLLAAGIMNAIAWFFFAFPMIQLAWVLSQRGAKSLWLHVAIALLVLAGSFTEWISRFMFIGSSMATELLVTQFNLDTWAYPEDGVGWRALEVTHIITTGLIAFIDAFEWIALFFILLFVHVSVKRWRVYDDTTFGACWNVLGLFISLLSLCDFVAEVLRVVDGTMVYADIAFWYSGINRLVLMPLWLLILGCQLPAAAAKSKETAQQRAVAASHSTQNGGNALPAGQLT